MIVIGSAKNLRSKTSKKKNTHRIVIVEDHVELLESMRQFFVSEGYEVETLSEGGDALRLITQSPPDVVILDWNLPDIDGLKICHALRTNHTTSHIPVLMISALDRVNHKVSAFEFGVDDYLTKPFDLRELKARVQSLIRRTMTNGTTGLFSLGPIKLDPATHEVMIHDQPISLRPKEYELLCFLMQFQGQTFSRDKLLAKIWGPDQEFTVRTIDAHITRLRQQLGPKASKLIQTIPGYGYRFKPN